MSSDILGRVYRCDSVCFWARRWRWRNRWRSRTLFKISIDASHIRLARDVLTSRGRTASGLLGGKSSSFSCRYASYWFENACCDAPCNEVVATACSARGRCRRTGFSGDNLTGLGRALEGPLPFLFNLPFANRFGRVQPAAAAKQPSPARAG